MKKKVFTALGLMTGTSVDGVDLSLIKSDGLNYFTSILDKYYKFENSDGLPADYNTTDEIPEEKLYDKSSSSTQSKFCFARPEEVYNLP